MEVLFPSNNFTVTQSTGVDKTTGESRFATSHGGYKAIDITTNDGKIYAPCDLTCIYHQRVNILSTGGQTAYLTVFASDEEIECVDGTTGTLIIYCTHGALAAASNGINLAVNATFNKNDPFYMQGTDNGLDENGFQQYLNAHIHINAGIGEFTGWNSFSQNSQGYLYLTNEKFIEDIFYLATGGTVNFADNIDAYEFTFETLFDPTGKTDGWYTHEGEIYYVEDEECVTGWLSYGGEYYFFNEAGTLVTSQWIRENNVPMYYVDSTGVRVKGWVELAYPGSATVYWFYFNNPDDYNITSLEPGEKATSRWIASGSEWYYVNGDGKMLTDDWIAADSTGNVWYFVLSDGKMAYSCQIRTRDGLYYGFNSSGVCVNNNGSTTKLNETMYPLVKDYTI